MQSIGLILVFVLVVLVRFLALPPGSDDPILLWDTSRILVSFPVMCFGFCAHVVMLPAVRPMRCGPTRLRFSQNSLYRLGAVQARGQRLHASWPPTRRSRGARGC